MKNTIWRRLLILAGLLVPPAFARAGIYYELKDNTAFWSLRVGVSDTTPTPPDYVLKASGATVLKSTSATSGYYVLRAQNNSGTNILTLTQGGVLAVPGGVTAPLTGNVTGNLTGNVTGNVTGALTGNADTATALAATPTAASSGFLCRGVSTTGACLPAATDATTAGVSGSTLPWTSGAAFTAEALNAKLAGATFTGASGITNQAFTATGANGNLVSASSITTTGSFFGDGSHLTGISGTLSGGANGFGVRWTGASSVGTASFEDNGSSFTFRNPSVVRSSMTFGTGVRLSTTSVIAADNSWTNYNSVAGCSASTVTVVTTEITDFRVVFKSSAHGDVTTRCSGVLILMDGIVQNWQTVNSMVKSITGCAAITSGQIDGEIQILNVAAGTHRFCWGGFSSNNGVTWTVPDMTNTGQPAVMTVNSL